MDGLIAFALAMVGFFVWLTRKSGLSEGAYLVAALFFLGALTYWLSHGLGPELLVCVGIVMSCALLAWIIDA